MQIQNDFPLNKILWYKIGGTAKYFITCVIREDILEALEFIEKKSIEKIFVCGLGSNLIFSDEYFDGAVIRIATNGNANDIRITEDGLVEVFAGVVLDDLIKFSFEQSLTGLEWAGGLPGTVGAAVRGNVGAYGGEIKDTIFSADVLDCSTPSPVFKTLTKDELQFVYRGSIVKSHKKMVVVSARFKLQKATNEDLEKAREIYNKNIQSRKDKHPLEYPNCGSVFKNLREKEKIEKVLSIYPEFRENVEKKWYGKVAVASLIEKLGLKGYRIGDAQVSEKHALFIINLGNAKAADVRSIISEIQEKFQKTFGFYLEVEVEVVK